MGPSPKQRESISMKEFTERLARKNDEDPKRVGRLLQNWVIAGLVRPDGLIYGGTGNYRAYAHEELDKAAILFEAYRYGLPMHRLQNIRFLLDESLEAILSEMPAERRFLEATEPGAYKGRLLEARAGYPWILRLQLPRREKGSMLVDWFIDWPEEGPPWDRIINVQYLGGDTEKPNINLQYLGGDIEKPNMRSMILLRVDEILQEL